MITCWKSWMRRGSDKKNIERGGKTCHNNVNSFHRRAGTSWDGESGRSMSRMHQGIQGVTNCHIILVLIATSTAGKRQATRRAKWSTGDLAHLVLGENDSEKEYHHCIAFSRPRYNFTSPKMGWTRCKVSHCKMTGSKPQSPPSLINEVIEFGKESGIDHRVRDRSIMAAHSI